MAQRRSIRWIGRGIAATALSATLFSSLPAQAAPWSNRFEFASQSFRNVWNETDASPGDRSLTWGPRPWFDYREFYKQSPRGLRQVQYFDKARMEINNPSAAQSRFYVTNGLLPVEMISGRVKLGDANSADQFEQRDPAAVPVAGDLPKVNPDAPTYASFRLVATTNNDNPAQERLGQRVKAVALARQQIHGLGIALVDDPAGSAVDGTCRLIAIRSRLAHRRGAVEEVAFFGAAQRQQSHLRAHAPARHHGARQVGHLLEVVLSACRDRAIDHLLGGASAKRVDDARA
jgi:hypothetical protein